MGLHSAVVDGHESMIGVVEREGEGKETRERERERERDRQTDRQTDRGEKKRFLQIFFCYTQNPRKERREEGRKKGAYRGRLRLYNNAAGSVRVQ